MKIHVEVCRTNDMNLMSPHTLTRLSSVHPFFAALVAVIAWGASRCAHAQCETAQLLNPVSTGDVYGAGPCLQGDLAVIGSPGKGTSMVHLFELRDGRWSLAQTLPDPEAEGLDQFGFSCDLWQDRLVIGDNGGTGVQMHSGTAYVYHLGVEGASLQTELVADDGNPGDKLGWSVAIDGDVIVVGARDDNFESLTQVGSGYVFYFDPKAGKWLQAQKLTAPEPQQMALMGSSVAVEQDVIVVGAHGTDMGRGAAHVFRRTGKEWEHVQELTAFDATSDMRFGQAVAMHDGWIAVGAPQAHTEAGFHRGAVYVFRPDGDRWVHEQKLEAANPLSVSPYFGRAFAWTEWLGHRSILVGAAIEDAVHVFRETDRSWEEFATLGTSDSQSDFGVGVACDGDRALITSSGGGAGKGYIFEGAAAIDCNRNGVSDACDLLDDDSLDVNNDGIPDVCLPPADLNGDGDVDKLDLAILIAAWGRCDTSSCSADLSGDGTVNGVDLGILLAMWT